MDYCNDFTGDLKTGQLGEHSVGQLLSHTLIEVKTDFQARWTGNVFVEYISRDKHSGLCRTQSPYWAFIIPYERTAEEFAVSKRTPPIFFIGLEELKAKCRKYWKTGRVAGGDNNTSMGILLPLKELTLLPKE